MADSRNRQSTQDLVAGMQWLDASVAPAGPLQPTASAVSFAPEPEPQAQAELEAQAESPGSAHQGLVFQTDNGSTAEDGGMQALSLIAQVYFKSHQYSKMCPHYLVFSCHAMQPLGRLTY